MLASAQAAPVKMLGFDDMSCAAWIASKVTTTSAPFI
jgi:hypothetical protein